MEKFKIIEKICAATFPFQLCCFGCGKFSIGCHFLPPFLEPLRSGKVALVAVAVVVTVV